MTDSPVAAPPALFRAPMRSRDARIPDDGAAVERALAIGVVGMGGAVPPAPTSGEAAVAMLATAGDERAARRLHRFVDTPDGARVVTRDARGRVHLGRLDGAYRYDDSHAAHAVDLVHVRPCRWLPEPLDDADVPAAVHQTFARGGLNWQRVRDDRATALADERERQGSRVRG